MELNVFFSLLRKRTAFLLVVMLVSAAAAVLAVSQADGAQKASVTVSLVFTELYQREETAVQYDGYYLIEAERRFGDLLGRTLVSDQLKRGFEEQTGATLGRTERISPIDFETIFLAVRDLAHAVSLSSTLEALLRDDVQKAVSRSGEPLTVTVAVGDAALRTSFWTLPKAAVVGALLGLLLGIFLVLLRHASRPDGVVIEEELIEVRVE